MARVPIRHRREPFLPSSLPCMMLFGLCGRMGSLRADRLLAGNSQPTSPLLFSSRKFASGGQIELEMRSAVGQSLSRGTDDCAFSTHRDVGRNRGPQEHVLPLVTDCKELYDSMTKTMTHSLKMDPTCAGHLALRA